MNGVVNVTTWADAFGHWHSCVVTKGVGNEAAAWKAGREAIVSELELREPTGFAPEVVGVALDRRDSQYGMLSYYFNETNKNEEN